MTQTHSNNDYIADRNWRRLHSLQSTEHQPAFSKTISNKQNTESDFFKSLARHKLTVRNGNPTRIELYTQRVRKLKADIEYAKENPYKKPALTVKQALAEEAQRVWLYKVFGFDSKEKPYETFNNLLFPTFQFEHVIEDAEVDLLNASPWMTEGVELTRIRESAVRSEAAIRLEREQREGIPQDVELKYKIRRLMKVRRKVIEAIALHAKIIGGEFGKKRCTNYGFQKRKLQIEQQDLWAKSSVISNGSESFCLNSSGEIRTKKHNELYVLMEGMEAEALRVKHKFIKAVVTLQPFMHPNPQNGNCSWDGTLPDEAAHYLQKQWGRFRSNLTKHKIKFEGIWTREAHADATPHVNILLGFHPRHEEKVKKFFNKHFKHSDHAHDWEDIRTGTGNASFASYAMKFVSYSTKFIQDDGNFNPEMLSEETWSSAFGLRRYGIFGMPQQTLWRCLRRQRNTPADADPLLLSMWRAARNNDAAKWIRLNGGLDRPPKQRPCELVKEFSLSGRSEVVVGIRLKSNGAELISKRVGEWSIYSYNEAKPFLNQIKSDKPFLSSDKPAKNEEVTVSLSYPRDRALPPLTPPNLLTINPILPTPPLIH